CVTNYAFPFVGGKFGVAWRGELLQACLSRRYRKSALQISVMHSNRIGAVRAMQRAPIRNLGEQSVWAGIGHTRYYFTLGYHNSASSALDASKAAEARPHSKTSPQLIGSIKRSRFGVRRRRAAFRMDIGAYSQPSAEWVTLICLGGPGSTIPATGAAI